MRQEDRLASCSLELVKLRVGLWEKNDSMALLQAGRTEWLGLKRRKRNRRNQSGMPSTEKNETFEKEIRVSKFAQSTRRQRSGYSRPRQCCVHSNFQVGLKEDLGDARSESESRRLTNEQRAELSRNLHYLIPSVALSLKTLAESGLVP